MAFSIILSITDTQPLRGFIPDSIEDSSIRMTPALASRVFANGYQDEENRRKLQERVQHEIHKTQEPQPHINAWYLSDIDKCKEVLDGILKVLKKSDLSKDEGSFSKTLHYLSAHKHITPQESDQYHEAFKVTQYAIVTIALGLTDKWMGNMTGIFFNAIFSKPNPAENESYVRVFSQDIIHKNIRESLREKGDNSPTYMACKSKRAFISAEHVRLFLNALLEADVKEYRPFWHPETCLINKASFENTFKELLERKLLTVEEVNHYSKQFFNG
ncbi:MAG: hypothetical protein ACK4HV_02400 [Parachlamydiaceae bacterium]